MKAEKVIFINNELDEAFNNLSDKDSNKKALKKAIANIQENPFCGRNVKKKLIPKKYNVNNLWIYNLPSAWRLIYNITTNNEIEIIAVILDWMNHKDYERLFGF